MFGVDLVYGKDAVVKEVLYEYVFELDVFGSLGHADTCSHAFA